MRAVAQLNATVSGFRCSKSGHYFSVSGLTRPLGRCTCCPGLPLLVEYHGERVAAAWREPSARARGLFRFAPGLPVSGLGDDYAGDVGGSPALRHGALSDELGV